MNQGLCRGEDHLLWKHLFLVRIKPWPSLWNAITLSHRPHNNDSGTPRQSTRRNSGASGNLPTGHRASSTSSNIAFFDSVGENARGCAGWCWSSGWVAGLQILKPRGWTPLWEAQPSERIQIILWCGGCMPRIPWPWRICVSACVGCAAAFTQSRRKGSSEGMPLRHGTWWIPEIEEWD